MYRMNISRATMMMVLVLTTTLAWSGEIVLAPTAHLQVQTRVGGEVNRHLIKFDLDTIPPNVIIDLAVITLNVDLDTTIAAPLNLMAYPVSVSWTGSVSPTITTVEYLQDESFLAPLAGKMDQEAELKVTGLVQAWVSGKMSNNGLFLMVHENAESKLDLKTEKLGAVAKLEIFYSDAPVEK